MMGKAEGISANHLDWCIAVFARNEERRIRSCLDSLRRALRGYTAHIILIVNGATDGTSDIAAKMAMSPGAAISIYTISYGCKSNAMNVFIEQLRHPSKFCLFVDATAFVETDAIRELEKALIENPEKLAASGLPRNGRDAARMRREAMTAPRLFGQMFAVRSEFLNHAVSLGRRLPVGLYRGDGLLSGFLCWETNGVSHEYAEPRIATVPTAYWRIEPISWFRPKDIKVGFNRLIRQARGRLENQAWNSFVWTKGFGALPRFADDMILAWLETSRPRHEGLLDRLFTELALRQIRTARRPLSRELSPVRRL